MTNTEKYTLFFNAQWGLIAANVEADGLADTPDTGTVAHVVRGATLFQTADAAFEAGFDDVFLIGDSDCELKDAHGTPFAVAARKERTN